MKKTACLFLVFLLLLGLTACGESKKPINAEDFISRMEGKGFQIVDATDQFEAGATKSVTIALNDNYQIEFYVLPSTDQATAAFNTNKSSFETMEGNGSSHVSKNIGSYSYYSLTTSEGYYVTARIENTFLYATVAAEYKSEVGGIIKELGY